MHMQKAHLNSYCLVACLFCSLSGNNVIAATVDGVKIPETIVQADTGRKLLLNGAGIRSKFIFSIYIGALYLPVKMHDVPAILKADVPNRVLMHCLYHEIEKAKLVDAWNEGFNSNLNQQQRKDLHGSIAQFNGMFPALNRGDVVLLDYIPGKGTRLSFNGRILGTVEGRDFNKALLSIWLGEHPADTDLKAAMLGTESE
jgi:hypothetical protein